MKRQCKAKKRNGERCPNPAGESGYCFTHDPDRHAERSAARKLGGYHRRTPVRISGDEPIRIDSMSDVLKLINTIIMDTWIQENGAARSRALLACADAAIKVLTMTDIEARIAKLEAVNEKR
jgi:hypothetical protein